MDVRKSWPQELTQCASSMTKRASCLRRYRSSSKLRNASLLTICARPLSALDSVSERANERTCSGVTYAKHVVGGLLLIVDITNCLSAAAICELRKTTGMSFSWRLLHWSEIKLKSGLTTIVTPFVLPLCTTAGS